MPTKPNPPTDDDNAEWEAAVIDWGVDCAVRHNALVNWATGREP